MAPMPGNIGSYAAMLHQAGDINRSEELIQKLLPGDAYGAPLALAHYYLYCGELDNAIRWSEKAVEQRQPAILFFVNVHLERLRACPRWADLAKLMNLPG
jgi:hypothetical protein